MSAMAAPLLIGERSVDAVVIELACSVALVTLALVPIRGEDRFAGGRMGLVRGQGSPTS